MFKRPFDFVLGGLGLLFSLPLWLLIALLIFLEDGRPVFFRQPRHGRGGRLFSVLKFRSMYKNPGSHEVQATTGDPRITRVGRMMRKTALDELPQVWNIFRGDVSFVGPRSQPEMEQVLVDGVRKELLICDVPGYDRRQSVRPGLTGIAQLHAPRDVPHRRKFTYDLIYVRMIERNQGFLGSIRMLFFDIGLIARSVLITVSARWGV